MTNTTYTAVETISSHHIEATVQVHLSLDPDGQWQAAYTSVDGEPLDLMPGHIGHDNTMCEDCPSTKAHAEAVANALVNVRLPTGAELAILLARAATDPVNLTGPRERDADRLLHELREHARAEPDSELGRRVLALFGDPVPPPAYLTYRAANGHMMTAPTGPDGKPEQFAAEHAEHCHCGGTEPLPNW